MQKTMSAFVLLLTLSFAPSIAQASDITFNLQSQHPNVVSLEFYSQNRNAAWPGDGQVYIMDDYNTQSYKLNCQAGEQICYGAWVRNQSQSYWGVGMDDGNYCTDCCYTCNGGSTPVITLNP